MIVWLGHKLIQVLCISASHWCDTNNQIHLNVTFSCFVIHLSCTHCIPGDGKLTYKNDIDINFEPNLATMSEVPLHVYSQLFVARSTSIHVVIRDFTKLYFTNHNGFVSCTLETVHVSLWLEYTTCWRCMYIYGIKRPVTEANGPKAVSEEIGKNIIPETKTGKWRHISKRDTSCKFLYQSSANYIRNHDIKTCSWVRYRIKSICQVW